MDKATDDDRGTLHGTNSRGVRSLQRIAQAIRHHPTTGQRRRLTALLAGLYNGPRFPFDMTDLRGLDDDLRIACLDVIALDSAGVREIHTWGVFDADELNAWLLEDGHYYAAQARRISSDLYRAKFGDAGHEDEGLTG
jgi:hypothetical protein